MGYGCSLKLLGVFTHPGSPNQLEVAPVLSVGGELGVLSLQERLQLLDMDSP